MKIISCASYYGSGSSAITDLVSEFDGVYSFSDEEFRFVQDPDGISDLEYNLVENFNRHNSGHAIKRFKRLVDFYSGNIFGKKYSAFFGNKWKAYSYEYIDNLTDFTYNGWWQYDLIDKGNFFYFRKRIINKILHLTFWRSQPERTLNNMKKEITYCAHPSEEMFLNYTRSYIDKLFSSVSNSEIIMVDQIVPPTNLTRYIRYFNDIQIIVVDRDPRDIFFLEKYFWKDGVIPSDVQNFCKWFKYTRAHRKTNSFDNKYSMYVQFEDLIYNYNNTVERIVDWLGLGTHKKKYTYFNPNKSMLNTKVWEKVPNSDNERMYIERELSEYLYNFNEMT